MKFFEKNVRFFIFPLIVLFLYEFGEFLNYYCFLFLSGRNESDANKKIEREKAFAKTKEYVWRQNKVYVGEAIC